MSIPEMLKSVAAVKKEVASIDRLFKNKLQQVQEKEEGTTKKRKDTASHVIDTAQPDGVDKLKKDERRKISVKKGITLKGKCSF